jgi:tetratricopeptide (TPR) repeat protein
MIVPRLILELLILAVSGLGSGLFILRGRKIPPVEKLCLAIGISWVLVYFAGTAIYLAHLPVTVHFAVSGGSLVLLALSWGELRNLWRSRQVRQTVYGFLLLLFWNLLMLSLIRHYSGGPWSGDWYEHYQRSLFFVDYLPRNTRFIDLYDLPARPPMMNILCAHVLAQVGDGYDFFQPAFAFLNLLIYFPCVLLTSALARRGRRQIILLVILFALSPVLVENVNYTWTKLFCGFYVLLGTWLYLRGYQKQDSARLVAGFAALCAGILAHYSAGPYLLFFVLHYAYVWRLRKRRWLEPLMTAAVCAPLLATWFCWSIWFYGWHTTVSSNTAVADTQQLTPVGNLQKIATNIFSTFVPHPFHISSHDFDAYFYQPNAMGHLRDYWFLIYQLTLPAEMGIVGGLVVVYLLIRKLFARKTPAFLVTADPPRPVLPVSLRIFWGGFVVVCTLVGIAVHGAEIRLGVGHICLLPLSLLGIAFLAANFPSLPPWLRRCVAAFAVFDFCLGVFLHIRMENLYFEPRMVGASQLIPFSGQLLCRQAVLNSLWRAQQQLPYLADHFVALAAVFLVLMILLAAALLHPLALATRGTALPLRRRPDLFFYPLLLLLAAGTLYCMKDELDGSAAAARQILSASTEQLQQYVADASRDATASPNSPQALLALGEALYRAGITVSATDYLSVAYILDPLNPRAHYDVNLLYYTGTPFRQESALRMNIADNVYFDPNSPDARQQLGTLLLLQHHPIEAVSQLNAAVALSDGGSPESLMLLGAALQQIGGSANLEQSIDDLTRALRLQPDSAEIAGALRNSLRMRGDNEQDIDAFIERTRAGQ